MHAAFEWFLGCIGAFLVLSITAGFILTVYEGHTGNQRAFTAGTLPSPLPEGLLHGSVWNGMKVSWQGKIFSSKAGTGINLFMTNGVETRAYPFKTFVAQGLKDDRQVLQINYDSAENPWWVRRVVDEIVQTAPGEYLGKVHVRVIPGFPFTVSYFTLRR